MKTRWNHFPLLLAAGVIATVLLGNAGAAFGQEEEPATGYALFKEGPDYVGFALDNLWILISAALVFIMHLGFATLESGLTRRKNTVNILFKNVFIVCVGAVGYMLWGFNAMYPGNLNDNPEAWNSFFALGKPIENGFYDAASQVANLTSEYANYTYWSDFIFQAMFAATAATIVSGAVAERVKLTSFMVFATLLVTFLYPISGSWEWGTGWLNGTLGGMFGAEFIDFAGSSLVHGFGGFAALACVIVLGPRKGKFTKGGVHPILGHSMPLAAIGVFLLFFGWFGFNGGSVLSADAESVSRVFVTTAMAAFAGGLAATFTSWIVLRKPDLSMALNGILAGLVGITAGAGSIPPFQSLLVGLIAGALVVFSVIFFDKIRIDDPVGAVSVHGICGIWGTVAVGIFGNEALAGESISLTTQIVGTLSVCAFAFITSFILFSAIKMVMGVRVDEEEEVNGLDVAEHGIPAYGES